MPKKKLIMIIAAVAAVVLLGGGFFAYKKMSAKPAEGAVAEASAKEEGKGKEEGKAKEGEKGKEGEGKEGEKAKEGAGNKFMGPTNTLNFVVNLADMGRPRFLKVNMEIELEDAAAQAELEAIRPKARDTIISILSSHSTEELSTIGDKQKLKYEVLHRLNGLMTAGKVREVYFSEFMIQ